MNVVPRILIVDDEPDAAEYLKLLIERRGYLVRTALCGAEATETLATWQPAIVLMDVVLPDVDGVELLRRFKDLSPESQVIMVTGYGSVQKAVEAMRIGAFTFLEKPVDPELLVATIEKAGEKFVLSAENRRLREELREHTSFANIIGRSDDMRRLFHLIKMVAPTDASVLIQGENGTGKELVATAIHEHSKRVGRPFIKINCAAIPAELMESELFGHRKGSFTGAVADKVGLMELADGGSLLLDEIGEMPASLQVKLLRVLQEREFRAVGGSRVVRTNFRLISATNADIEAALREGRLREDLYFRINTMTLTVPPLRDRPEDVTLLVEQFRARFAAQHGRDLSGVAPDAMKMLARYRWPGNVRELEHVIERAVIVAEGRVITPADLPAAVRDQEQGAAIAAFTVPPHHTLAEIEKLAILQTLERTSWNKRRAASILGVYRPTLYNKLRKHHLESRSPAAEARAKSRAKPAAPAGTPPKL